MKSESGSESLSDAEKREVTRLIEDGKPLPDRYRFLLFGEGRQVELVYNGKTDEVCRVRLPFQTVEQVDEPRAEAVPQEVQDDMFSLDARGRQERGWTNKLIWGDNKLILASLQRKDWQQQIREQGGLKLIYIDPPFDVGADFSMKVEVGDGEEEVEKLPNALEELVYRDTWSEKYNSYLVMIHERLKLMHDLLADDGSIYVHCDYRVNSYLRLVLDEVFGKDNFRNEIVWYYKNATMQNTVSTYIRKNQNILFYSKQKNITFIPPRGDKFTEDILNRFGKIMEANGDIKYKNAKNEKSLLTRVMPRFKKEYGRLPDDEDVIYKVKIPKISSVWDDVPQIRGNSDFEHLGYPTQKPLALLERIIEASSNEGDLVADFFCGSGTLPEVAERSGRKWIAADLSRFAIHTTRKRMLQTQRALKQDSKPYRAFEILNLGKYERQLYFEINKNLPPYQQEQQRTQKGAEYVTMILDAYSAKPLQNDPFFHGTKKGRFVYVGPIGFPVSEVDINRIVEGCQRHSSAVVDVLGFEFAPGLGEHIERSVRGTKCTINPKYIPQQVFDARVVEKDEITFYDLAYVKATPRFHEGNKVSVVIENFYNAYDEDTQLRVEGKVKHWHDWIDYWSVDFDWESKREIIRHYADDNSSDDDSEDDSEDASEEDKAEYTEEWSGRYIFENEWQSFRTRNDRTLLLETPPHPVAASRKEFKIAVKVIDIFGNDTTSIVEVSRHNKDKTDKAAKPSQR